MARPKLQQQSQEDGQCCTSLKNPQLGCAGGCWAPPAPGVCSQSKTDCESGCGGGGNVKWCIGGWSRLFDAQPGIGAAGIVPGGVRSLDTGVSIAAIIGIV